ncbi:hypothetical protein ACH4Y0_08055 [Streptomyces sp. NPDC020707]|uniref:hypothetical protein n=1 Tax=Streptomyces sp. NPDC020707 TaxID=3365084 RepID=UPI0037A68446
MWGPGTTGLDIIGHCALAEVDACTAKGPTANTYHALLGVTESLISVVPLLVAAFAGGALIGRELDSGTAELAWTQSVSPARWLTAKLALPATLLVLGTLALVLLRRLVASSSGGLASSKWHTSTSVYDSWARPPSLSRCSAWPWAHWLRSWSAAPCRPSACPCWPWASCPPRSAWGATTCGPW